MIGLELRRVVVVPARHPLASHDELREEGQVEANEDDDGERIKASPVARKMASENKINLVKVEGTGPGGRIIKKDIEAVLTSNQKDTDQIVDLKPQALKEKQVEEKTETGKPLPSTISTTRLSLYGGVRADQQRHEDRGKDQVRSSRGQELTDNGCRQ